MARHKHSNSTASSVSSESSHSSTHSASSAIPAPPKKKATRSKKKRRLSGGDEKRATTNKESDIDPHKEFLATTKQLINVGLALQQHNAAENGELSEDEDTQVCHDKQLSKMSSKVREQYKRNFAWLLQLSPSFKPLLGNPHKATELNAIIKKMDATISATHSDDASRLKSQISHYVAFNTKDHPICPAIYNGSGLCTHMGINHPVLARFLCPVRELKRFSEDANKGLKDIQCSKINLTASALPTFLWAGDLPGEDYDDDNMFEGMFDGYLLERHIFTSPSSAYGGEMHTTRTCNAVLHNMTTVDAAHIAYGCLQVRFGISAKNTWSKINGSFNYRDFYNNIVKLIKDLPDPEWKEELLKAWNVKLFKNEEGHNNNTIQDGYNISGSREDTNNDLARIHAQMTVRHAAKAVLTPASSNREPTPVPSCEPTPVPSHEPTPVPSREPTPAPPPLTPKPRPIVKPKPAVPADPVHTMSRAPSELTEAEPDEDSEPVQPATKNKKKAHKAPARKSSRK
ncbi:hypothetical protein EDB19DRAFT_1917834 [Suillus lakei]|nr:hypothetical protein EDB19DRAFT_1917834 [Suillus lakei]